MYKYTLYCYRRAYVHAMGYMPGHYYYIIVCERASIALKLYESGINAIVLLSIQT